MALTGRALTCRIQGRVLRGMVKSLAMPRGQSDAVNVPSETGLTGSPSRWDPAPRGQPQQ